MKIAFLGLGLGPRAVEGARNHSWGLACALAARGHDVDILTGPADVVAPIPPRIRLHSTRGRGVAWSGAALGAAVVSWRRMSRRVMRERAPDVVHGHHRALAMSLFDRGIAGRAPLVESHYAAFYDGSGRDLRGPLLSVALERVPHALVNRATLARALGTRRADVLHTFTQAGARELRKARSERAVHVIPPGINAIGAPLRGQERARPVVGYMGHFTYTKGAHLLPAIFSRIARASPECDFLLAPSGAGTLERDVAARLGAEGLRPRVSWRRSEPAASILSAIDVLVAPRPCAYGTMQPPLSLLEAAAAGVPVVTTDVAGNAEVVEDGVSGRVVRAGDVDALAEATTTLVADAARLRDMGAAAQAHARAYDWSVIAPRFEQMYREVAG